MTYERLLNSSLKVKFGVESISDGFRVITRRFLIEINDFLPQRSLLWDIIIVKILGKAGGDIAIKTSRDIQNTSKLVPRGEIRRRIHF